LEIAICDIKKKLIHEEAGRSLKVKDAEVSSTKITEDLTGKYLKEISSI
jgi:ssDNA-binding replication factor A large subunit